MTMAGTVFAMVQLVADLGLSSSLIHFPLPGARTLSALYWLNLGTSLVLALVLATLASPISDSFGHQELFPLLALLSLVFPLNAFGQQSRVLAEKRLEFGRLATIEIISAISGVLTAVIAAWQGIGAASFVIGVLFASASSSLLLRQLLPIDPRSPFLADYGSIKPYMRYGFHRIGEQLWNAIRMQSDLFIASLNFAPSAVAFYATPRDQSLRIANSLVNPIASRVGLPVMATMQGNPIALRNSYFGMVRMAATINFPIYAILACFPLEIISLFLGEKWLDAGPFLRIFALWGLIRSTGNLSGPLLYAAGRVRRAHLWNFATLCCTIPLLWMSATYWSLQGLALSMLGLQVALFFAAWKFLIQPACGASMLEYLSQISRPLLATILATMSAFAAVAPLNGTLRLVVGSIVLFVAYAMFSYAFNRSALLLCLEVVKPAFGHRAARG
jgi:O-antigen/teichoic acid export membrane protein